MDDEGRPVHATITFENIKVLILRNYQIACNLSSEELEDKAEAVCISAAHKPYLPMPLPLFLACVRKNPTLFCPIGTEDADLEREMEREPGRLRDLEIEEGLSP